MLHFYCPTSQPHLAEIVEKAFKRSLTTGAVRRGDIAELNAKQPILAAFANAPEEWGEAIVRALAGAGNKIILFGALPAAVARLLDVTVAPFEKNAAFDCASAPSYAFTESPAVVHYGDDLPLGLSSPIQERACRRYDFTDEWNNRVFGAINADGDIWSVAQRVSGVRSDAVLADIVANGQMLTSYAAVWSVAGNMVLWFNRPVGPVDSQEWKIVEDFIAHAGYPSVACAPVIGEVPYGYDVAATMRLDCDEDIASSKILFDHYRDQGVPFSLAIHTTNFTDNHHDAFLHEVVASGGSLLTHSATHAPNWGGSFDAALNEVCVSRDAIKAHTDYDIRYAVSPFHQNPDYAVRALADSGLQGFAAGIIRNDPEYLIARGGVVPAGPDTFISHTQGSMLHGACVLGEGDPLAVYLQAADEAVAGGALFGFLDHPFSPRYAYGWESEEQRRDAHARLISHLRGKGRTLFMSCEQALDWIRLKSSLVLTQQGPSWAVSSSLISAAKAQPFTFRVLYGGAVHDASWAG